MLKKQLHIVHIIPSLYFGGAERFVVDLVTASDPERFRFTIISFSPLIPLAQELNSKTTKVLVLQKRGRLSLHLFFDLYRTLKKLQPDLVHTNMFSPDLWGRIVAGILKLPVISTEHNINFYEGWLKNSIKRWMKNWSKEYVACSESIAEYARTIYRITRPMTVIRSGIRLEKFVHVSEAKLVKTYQLLILGRLTEQKGHRYALRALANLQETEWKLSIVGEGELKKKLQDEVQRLGLEERVTFFPPTPQVPEFLEKSDVLLIPSVWEGLGVVAMEAMSAGRIVVASNVGGLREVIHDQKDGFLCEAKNITAWMERLQWCFTHPKELKGIMKQAQQKAQKEFGAATMAEKYKKIYERVVRS
jgi:glycosyltransferase involved in cell wall biosynthesis